MGKCITVIALLLIGPSLLSPAGAWATQPSPADLIRHLQRFYTTVQSLSLDFEQVTRTGGRARSGRGRGIFVRGAGPDAAGIMRWDYTEPEPQVILNNGREISIYTPARRQMLISPVRDQGSDIATALFSGTRRLEDEFRPVTPDDRFTFSIPDTPLQVVRLIPRTPHPRLRAVQIWFDRKLLIRHLVLEDHLDSVTELSFSHIRLNPISSGDRAAIDRILDLDPAPNTEIIRQ